MSKIPKIIHYCWVGGSEKPKSVEYCIASWKKHCPDYEIIEWNESNYDFHKNQYMDEAYQCKKWGFVPDYARLDIVYQHGGIYMDTDVEIVESLDSLLEYDAFMGFENTGDGEFFVNCGHGFGAVPKHPIIKTARDLYDNLHFLNEDGSLNMIPSPHYTTQTLCNYGLIRNNSDQQLKALMVFASDVLCPKNFRTGKIRKTPRTVSIHHFTATWLDEEIKKALDHQQLVTRFCGKRLGHYVLIGESVVKKYGFWGLFCKLPVRILSKVIQKINLIEETIRFSLEMKKLKSLSSGKGAPVILDTALASDNCGDQIIIENCLRQLSERMNVAECQHVPTHVFINQQHRSSLKKANYKILCGTNILSGYMQYYGLWKMDKHFSLYSNTVLMGVGFASFDETFDEYSAKLLNGILSKQYLHSVRDQFSERMLKQMGIENVLYTGCPTMWSLTEEICKSIPTDKADSVITTITDYHQDPFNDKMMIEILCKEYNHVYLWIQGQDDLEYYRQLQINHDIIVVDNTLHAFDDILMMPDLDYVGTRLHAGIRALAKGHRTIVIAIDNRATCISEDTGLMILHREDVPSKLSSLLHDSFETTIKLPWNNIEVWKKQFK